MLDRKYRWTLCALIAFLSAIVVGSSAASAGDQNQIRAVAISEAKGTTTVRVQGSETPTFTVYKLERPARVVVDVARATLAKSVGGDEPAVTYAVGSWAVSQVVAQALEDGSTSVRIVITLARQGRYDVKAVGKDVLIEVVARDPMPATVSASDLAQATAEAADARRDAAAARAELIANRAAAQEARAAAAQAQADAEASRAAAAAARTDGERALSEAAAARDRAKAEAAQAQAALAAAERAKVDAQRANQQDRAAAERQVAAAKAELARAKSAAEAAQADAERAQSAAKSARTDAEREIDRARAEAQAARALAQQAQLKATQDAMVAKTTAEQDLQRAKAAQAAAERDAAVARKAAEVARAEAGRARSSSAKDNEASKRAAEQELARAKAAQVAAEAEIERARAEAAAAKADVARLATLTAQLKSDNDRDRKAAAKDRAEAERTLARAKAELAKIDAETQRAEAARATAQEAQEKADARERQAEAALAAAAAERQAALSAVEEAKRARRASDASQKSNADAAMAQAAERLERAEAARLSAESQRRSAEAAAAKARKAADTAQGEVATAQRRRDEMIAAADDAEVRRAAAEQIRRAEEHAAAEAKAAREEHAAAEAKAAREERAAAEAKAAREERAAAEAKHAAAEAKAAREERAATESKADPVVTRAPKPFGTPTSVAPAAARVTDIQFEAGADQHTIAVDLDGRGATAELTKIGSRRAELVVRGASLPAKLAKTLDVSRFSGPIKSVSSYTDGRGDIRIAIELATDATPRLETVGGDVRVRVAAHGLVRVDTQPPPVMGGFGATSAPVTQSSVAQLGKRRKVYRGPTIDLDFKEADIHDLLRLLADVGRVSIVVPDEINADVTVRMKRVPWDQALDVILAAKGLGYRKEGTLYRVAPQKQLDAEDEAEMARQKAMVEQEAPRPDVFTLNYASAAALQAKLEPLLSPKGKIEVDERTNSIIVNDIARNRREVVDLAARLDTQTPQISIEARIVEARSSYERQIGIQWGGRTLAGSSGGNATGLVFPSSVAVTGAANDTEKPSAGVTAPSDFAINLPAGGSSGALGLTLGSVGGNVNINLRLSALEETGTVRILSAPKVMALNNTQAEMKQGVKIPISITSAQGTQTQFINANLSLVVTPYVSQRDCSIVMDVQVTKDEPDFVNTGARGDPTILNKEARTRMLVADGETSVMGGIYTRNTGLSFSTIPFFGDLPVLGWLFKSRRENDDRAELLIFITPKIVNKGALRCVGG